MTQPAIIKMADKYESEIKRIQGHGSRLSYQQIRNALVLAEAGAVHACGSTQVGRND